MFFLMVNCFLIFIIHVTDRFVVGGIMPKLRGGNGFVCVGIYGKRVIMICENIGVFVTVAGIFARKNMPTKCLYFEIRQEV